MKSKHWVCGVLGTLCGILVVIGVLVVVADPFFHFHAPIEGMSYELNNEQYMNNGICRNFDYNAMITGTSMTEDFMTAEVDQLFGVKSVRTSFMGEGFKRINNNLEAAITYNPDLKFVIRGIDTTWFVSDADWAGYESYPEYLNDDIVWNDVNYIYNMDIMVNYVLPQLSRTLKRIPTQGFDDVVFADPKNSGREKVLLKYVRSEKKDEQIDEGETKEFFVMLDRNLEENVIHVIKENPDITFYLFFPPYSICWWDALNQEGEGRVERRIMMEKYAIEKLIPYSNVHLFSFFDDFELTCDLSNYIDEAHYIEPVSSYILKCMKEGEHELTQENYMEYIESISDFYINFDYDGYFNAANGIKG